jgi:hypothetical protein
MAQGNVQRKSSAKDDTRRKSLFVVDTPGQKYGLASIRHPVGSFFSSLLVLIPGCPEADRLYEVTLSRVNE